MAKKSNRTRLNESNNFKKKISFSILKQPKSVKTLKGKIIVISIIASLLLDLTSFTLKGAETAMEKGLITLAILMLILYFSQRIIESAYNTYSDLQNDMFKQIYSAESIKIIMQICNKTRSKVFKEEDNGKDTIMEDAEIIQKSKWYLDAVWNFWWHLPTTISECITLIGMIIAMIIVEIHDSDTIQTAFIMSLLIICIAVYFVLGKKRIKLKKQFRKLSKEADSRQEVLFTEIKNIDYISELDFEYHAKRLQEHINISNELAKDERLKLNNVFIQRSAIASGFMVAILLFKIYTCEVLDLSVILNVVAVSSVYSTILSKINKIMARIETVADTVIDITTLYSTFQDIMTVYEEEASKFFSMEDVEEITVGEFYATQDPKKMYLLRNDIPFSLKKNDFVLVEGPTGCGKSTLLLLLTGKLRIKNNPIQFSNGETGYLKSIVYQTDKAMANNFVLNEIILDDDTEKADKQKVLEILNGLSLYPELLRMANADNDLNLENLSEDDKVFELLKFRKTSQFSSGQRQRLALAKLLYTMTSMHQVIALDEAFNRLDDITAEKCIKFVKEFTQRDMQRIVLLATHQINLVRPICNKEISFTQELNISHVTMREI